MRTCVRMMGLGPYRPIRDLERALERSQLDKAVALAKDVARELRATDTARARHALPARCGRPARRGLRRMGVALAGAVEHRGIRGDDRAGGGDCGGAGGPADGTADVVGNATRPNAQVTPRPKVILLHALAVRAARSPGPAPSWQSIEATDTGSDRLRDTGREMSQESTTPDPVEITRQGWEAASRGEFGSFRDHLATHAVVDTAGYGMGTFEGREPALGFMTDWIGSFDDLTMEAEEIVDLGNGVVLTVYHQNGRPLGGTNYVRVRSAMVAVWVDGMIVRNTIYTEAEIDEARAAAKCLAAERG